MSAMKDAQAIIDFYKPYFKPNVSDIERGRTRLYAPICPINVIKKICASAKQIFMNEPMLLRLYNDPVYIVGDLHGHILDLFRTLGKIEMPPKNTILFLGDIVDRGDFSTESITIILSLKILYPDLVYIIRGNHEFLEMSRQSGFSAELYNLYDKDMSVEDAFMDAFSYIPIGAMIGKNVLCVHGGIGPHVFRVEQLEKIQRPLHTFDDDLVSSLLWSDPSRLGKGFSPSTRGIGYLFGTDELAEFLDSNNLKYLVRGHECVDKGIELQLNNRIFTVFGASNYCGMSPNKSGILIMKQDCSKEAILFPPINQHLKRSVAIVLKSESPDEFIVKKPAYGSTSALTPKLNIANIQKLPPLYEKPRASSAFDRSKPTARANDPQPRSSLLSKRVAPVIIRPTKKVFSLPPHRY